MNRKLREKIFIGITAIITSISCLILILLISVIFVNGIKAISIEFLLTESRDFGAKGGIFYQIIGSLLIVLGASILSFPVAFGAAICTSEFITNKTLLNITKTLIYGLNGVPSIIFGLFGLIFFVNFLNTGISWFVGSIILACMILPTILVATLHSMNSIPQNYRESALALGLDKWKVIISVIIPQGFSGAITGLLIGLARAIGETAPIMFIATAFSGVLIPTSLFEPVTTLPTHILALSQQATDPDALKNAWATALVLITLVFVFSISSLFTRIKYKGIGLR